MVLNNRFLISSKISFMRFFNFVGGSLFKDIRNCVLNNWNKTNQLCLKQFYIEPNSSYPSYSKLGIFTKFYFSELSKNFADGNNIMYSIKRALFKVSGNIRKRKKRRCKKTAVSLPNCESQVQSSSVYMTNSSPATSGAGNLNTIMTINGIDQTLVNAEDVTLDLIEQLKNIRCEIDTPYGMWLKGGWLDDRAKKGTSIKVLSYNVLAPYLVDTHSYLYRNHEKKYLQWKYRRDALINEFVVLDADILCLQEVETSTVGFFNDRLNSMGYAGVFKKRTNDKKDGCAIYYRKEKFVEKELVTVEFNQPGVQLLNRDNIGIIMRLSPKTNVKKNIVVATTHLLFNPRRPDVRLAQIQVMMAEIDRVAFKLKTDEEIRYYPVILTGDFNLKPNSYVYCFITKGNVNITDSFSTIPPHLGISSYCQHFDLSNLRTEKRLGTSDVEHIKLYHSERKNPPQVDEELAPWRVRNDYDVFTPCTFYHRLNLDSVYPQTNNATTFHECWCNVDYIFYGPRRLVDGQPEDGELKLVSYLRLPKTREAAILKNIPNEACASDHLPLLATFHLLEEVKTKKSKL